MNSKGDTFVFSVLVPIPNITDNCEFEYLPGEYSSAKIGQIVKIPFGKKGLIAVSSDRQFQSRICAQAQGSS